MKTRDECGVPILVKHVVVQYTAVHIHFNHSAQVCEIRRQDPSSPLRSLPRYLQGQVNGLFVADGKKINHQ